MTDDPGIKITVTDLKTGESESQSIVNDVVIITAGRHYVDGVQRYKNGTQVWTIKVDRGDES